MAIDINIPSQVKNYANLAAFPATGSLKTIFIAEDTNKTYRWTGSAYVEISASQATAWGAITGTLSNQTDLDTALSGKVPTTRTLTINGTTQDLSVNRTFTISTGITIGTTAITSGTVGRILFEGTGNVVQESANLFWDNTNGRLGINNATPTQSLDISGAMRIVTTGNYPITLSRGSTSGVAQQVSNSGTTTYFGTDSTGGGFLFTGGLQYASFFGNGGNYPTQFGTNGATRMTIFNDGNVGVNTTTNAGFKLDVNGTARIATSLVINGSSSLFSSSLSIYQNSTNRAFSIATSTTKTSAAERILFSLNSNDATNQQAMDFGYIGASLINDRYFYLQTSESSVGYGGGVAIQHLGGWASVGSATQIASSVFHITSTTKGFLPPRMTTTQKNAIASPVAGLMVYDTTLNKLCLRTASAWETITSL